MQRFWFLDLIKELLPENEWKDFQNHYTKPLSKSIKIIKKKITLDTFSQKESQWKNALSLQPCSFTSEGKSLDDVLSIQKDWKWGLGSHWMHQLGFFYVQEIAAWMSAQTIHRKENDLVLDLCAAPWGKTLQLIDQSPQSALILSNELNPQRRKALLSNLERCGNEQITLLGYDGRKFWDLLYETCDHVLLDAPCSGEWMQYKSDFQIFQWKEKEIRKIAQVQEELLISWLKALKIWGELTYSTCTLNPLENEGVLQHIQEQFGENIRFLPVKIDQKSPGIKQRRDEVYSDSIVNTVARFWPHRQKTWGFFIAKIQKLWTIGFQEPVTREQNTLWTYKEKTNQEIWNFLDQEYGIKKSDLSNFDFLESKYTFQVVNKNILPLLQKGLFWEQIWMPILKKLPNNVRIPLDWLAKIFWGKATKQTITCDTSMIETFLANHLLPCNPTDGKYLIVTRNGKGLCIYHHK